MADKHAEAYGEADVPIPMTGGDLPPSYSQKSGYEPQTAGITMVTVAPQALAYPPPSGPPPDDYLVMSILTTFFCFWPLGLFAILKSIEVRNSIARGDYSSAHIASKSALRFNKISILVGIIILIVTFIFVALCQLAWIIPISIFTSKSD